MIAIGSGQGRRRGRGNKHLWKEDGDEVIV